MPTPKSALSSKNLWGTVILLAGFYLWFVSAWFINVPRSDDLVSLLPFIDSWKTADTVQRLTLLFEQYFSHRIVAARLTTLGVYSILGELNFVVFQWIGLLLWLTLVGWLIAHTCSISRSAASIMPVALLLIQPAGITNISVSMQGTSNLGVLLLAWMTFVWSNKTGTQAFGVALVLSLVAIGTSANGLLVAPLLAASLFFGANSQRAFIAVGCWIAFAVLYFYGFERSGVGARTFSLQEFIGNFLAMLGMPFDLERFPVMVSQFIGLTLLVLALLIACTTRKRIFRDPVTLFVLFLLGSVALCAAGRVGWGAAYMGQDRYAPYGLLLAACIWMLIPARFKNNPWIGLPVIALCGIVSITSYAAYSADRQEDRRWDSTIIINQHLGHTFSNQSRGTGDIFQTMAFEKKIWRPPGSIVGLPTPDRITQLAQTSSSASQAPVFHIVWDTGRDIYTLVPQSLPPVRSDFALLVSTSSPLLLPASAERQTYLNMIRRNELVKSEKVSYLWSARLPPPAGSRLLGLGRSANHDWVVLWQSDVASFQIP